VIQPAEERFRGGIGRRGGGASLSRSPKALLVAENLCPRAQLLVLQRRHPRARLRNTNGWAGVRLTSRRRPKTFCRGERGAARTSSIRIARIRFGKLTPCDVSRSRSRWRGAVCHRKAYPHMPRCPDHLAARLPKEANTNRAGSDFVEQLTTLAGVENVLLTDANQCVALIMALETHFGRRSSATSWRSPNIDKKSGRTRRWTT